MRKSNNRNNSSPTALMGLNSLVQSANARAPQADVSNASYLMGDVSDFDGDDAYGDVDSPYGDVSTAGLDIYNTLIGEPYAGFSEIGAPTRRKPMSKNLKRGLIIGGAAAATTGGAILVANAIKKAKARKAAVRASQIANSHLNTIQNQVDARGLLGKIARNTKMPFYQVSGANLNAYPIVPTETFVASDLKWMLDKQSAETPFESEIVNGSFAGVTWTLTANGVASARLYPCVLIAVGISTLTANPGTIFTIAGSFPLVNGGVLTIATNPFSFTINQGWYAKMLLFPWTLITNRANLAMGSYNNANPIVATITGLPSNATTNMVVPGSLHPWTIGMRNALL